MPDPGLRLVCSTCGVRVKYLLTVADTHVYQCSQDGLQMLQPNGLVRPTTHAEVQARIDRGDLIS